MERITATGTRQIHEGATEQLSTVKTQILMIWSTSKIIRKEYIKGKRKQVKMDGYNII